LRDGISYRGPGRVYTPQHVKNAYGIPNLTGEGQKVGIIELGGAFSREDLIAYCNAMQVPAPPVSVVSVMGGRQRSDPQGADIEVMMDVEIVAALAPLCSVRLYFAPNSDVGFAAAVFQASQECDVVSISWGGPERSWPGSARQAMDRALERAAQQGVNVFVAAGDNGSGDGVPGNNVDYPSSSPYCIGCGGTTLILDPSGGIVSESVWNNGAGGATGGGYSKVYPQPDYQKGHINGSLRGVPDVAGPADPETGWLLRVNGGPLTGGGTSAVAPLWAAIACLLNQKTGKRVGWLSPILYSNPRVFNDDVTGGNGAYNAGPGWDACTGMGSPNGSRLFGLFDPPPPPPPPSPPPVLPPPVVVVPPVVPPVQGAWSLYVPPVTVPGTFTAGGKVVQVAVNMKGMEASGNV
jgi:kumamolisin